MSNYLKGLANKINGVEEESFTQELDINSLVPSKNNFYGIREVEDLAESIKENGLMHNLVVRDLANGKYEIISGERRYRALMLLEYKRVPCQIKTNLTDLEAELMLIKANTQQRELTPIERMEGIKRLEKIYKEKRDNGEKLSKKTRDLVGDDLGISGVTVTRYKKVDKDLIPEIKEKFNNKEITLDQALMVSKLKKEEQEILHDEIKDLNTNDNKHEIETLVEGIKQPVQSKLDKELINDMYLKNEDKKNIIEKFEKVLKVDPKPKLIILAATKAILETEQLTIVNGSLHIKLPYHEFNSCKAEFNIFEKVEEIPLEKDRKIQTEYGYKINKCTYLWFSWRCLNE